MPFIAINRRNSFLKSTYVLHIQQCRHEFLERELLQEEENAEIKDTGDICDCGILDLD